MDLLFFDGWDAIADLVGSGAVALVGLLCFRNPRVADIEKSMDGLNRP